MVPLLRGEQQQPAPEIEPPGLDSRPPNPFCHPPAASPSRFEWLNPFPELRPFSSPVALRRAPGDATSWFVVEQAGKVHQFENSPTVETSRPVLDIADRVAVVENGGLLGLAFHPRFTERSDQRFVYAFYTAPIGRATSHLSRFSWPEGAAAIDPSSEVVLISVQHDRVIHLNNDLHFGPDGYLYASMGDGGPQGDRLNRAQNPHDLRGKIWRIDVDGPAPYGIPFGNPFANGGGAPEIYALGFRNPFRFSFDPDGGALYAGDTGYLDREEINLVEAGKNYGWNCFEGSEQKPADWNPNCSAADFTLPIHEYNHDINPVSAIVGGRVYRGSEIPELFGKYVFGDFSTTQVSALDLGDGEVTDLGASGISVVDFAEAQDGEIFLTDYGSGTFRKLVLGSEVEPPLLLSATGCFEPGDPSRPLPALIPFDVRSPLWSDGARKRRWMALPDGSKIHVEADGDFTFPPGTVLVKEFSWEDGTRIETRFFVRHSQGVWSGYTYQWNEQQSDAALVANLPGFHLVSWGDRDWEYPSRGQCFACHTSAAGFALGPEILQLNWAIEYPETGRTANQLDTLAEIGMFDWSFFSGLAGTMSLAVPGSTGSIEEQARAVLHTNCSPCHRPEGPGRGPADFRNAVSLSEMGICDVEPAIRALGIDDARLVAPGMPERSLVLVRTARRGAGQMPPLATRTVDEPSIELLRQWIEGLQDCR